MAGGDVETVAAGGAQALASGPRLGYRCARVGNVDQHGGCGRPLCQHHHGRELPQWTVLYIASVRHLRNDCVRLVPGGKPAKNAISECIEPKTKKKEITRPANAANSMAFTAFAGRVISFF